MSVSNINLYIDYFRQLATKHKDIRHDPESETSDSAPGAKKFARWSADEVINSSLRSKVGFPALLLEAYETDSYANSVYDIRLQVKGAFTVLEHVRPNDFNDEERAFTLTEQIVYDILKQMWQDHHGPDADQCFTPFRKIDFGKLQITPVGPLFDNEFGYRVEFEFELQTINNITEAPEPGVFI